MLLLYLRFFYDAKNQVIKKKGIAEIWPPSEIIIEFSYNVYDFWVATQFHYYVKPKHVRSCPYRQTLYRGRVLINKAIQK